MGGACAQGGGGRGLWQPAAVHSQCVRLARLPHACLPAPAASVFWLPYQAYTLLLRPARPSSAGDSPSGGAAGAPSGSPLGDSALLLLLVLLFHAPPQARG
jgi:hypothetical protein